MSLSYTYAAVSPKGDPTAVRALADLRDVVLCVLWCGAPYEQKAEDIQPKQVGFQQAGLEGAVELVEVVRVLAARGVGIVTAARGRALVTALVANRASLVAGPSLAAKVIAVRGGRSMA